MVEIKKDSLEKALSKKSDEKPKMSREQEVAFHQGALNTLINERNEFFKIIQNVEAVMQAHIKRLEELGVKIQVRKNE
ncbi:hypothetical protein HYS72_03235 [Candidatus Pacearchaeota archaeon]|nr:hypothetical protein [Candidatus Pacearchaeota archaeon]MBI2056851.1 hypothetical protein [Candidatus Pacearchaeota archaeon]